MHELIIVAAIVLVGIVAGGIMVFKKEKPLSEEASSRGPMPKQAAIDAAHEAPAFDPRTEISAGARHVGNQIVMHLWIIFVVIPAVLYVVYSLFATH